MTKRNREASSSTIELLNLARQRMQESKEALEDFLRRKEEVEDSYARRTLNLDGPIRVDDAVNSVAWIERVCRLPLGNLPCDLLETIVRHDAHDGAKRRDPGAIG
ncbi:MAG TPA: hypothetical protein VKQ11_22630 [Candidatus Sulfotelmatobacter sp.]|nr:hypothetical protein [Candidatus Sulfotelmatobacter sp.]